MSPAAESLTHGNNSHVSGSTTATISWLILCTQLLNFYTTSLHRGKKVGMVFNIKLMSSTAKTCEHCNI